MCKYLHLSNTSSPILKAALNHSKVLAELDVNSWFKIMNRILDFGEINFQNIDNCDIDTKLKEIFVRKWESEKEWFHTEGKLGILSQCKDSFSMSDYLSSDIYPVYKRALAKFRVSAHKLPIEVERYAKTPKDKRLCILGCNEIGDEQHYLFECGHPGISEIYVPVISKLNSQSDEFNRLTNNQEKLVYMILSKDTDLLQLVGKLCHKVLDRFNEITW